MRKVRIVQGEGAKFEIVEDTGETIEQLAIWMAESLGKQSYYERQSMAYRQQSQNERKKAADRTAILFQLKEYNRQKKRDLAAGIERRVSRMEPMETFDQEMLEGECKLFKDRSNEFHKTADSFDDLARKESLKVTEYQGRIVELKKVNGNS